jgi:hypothetical protein
MQFFVERFRLTVDASAAQVTTRIADDCEEPRAPVAAGEGPKITKGAQRRILHNVLGILLVSHQPASEAMSGVEMWQDDVLEAFCLVANRLINLLCHVAFP